MRCCFGACIFHLSLPVHNLVTSVQHLHLQPSRSHDWFPNLRGCDLAFALRAVLSQQNRICYIPSFAESEYCLEGMTVGRTVPKIPSDSLCTAGKPHVNTDAYAIRSACCVHVDVIMCQYFPFGGAFHWVQQFVDIFWALRTGYAAPAGLHWLLSTRPCVRSHASLLQPVSLCDNGVLCHISTSVTCKALLPIYIIS